MAPAREWLAPWLGSDESLAPDPERIESLLAAWAAAPAAVAATVRISRCFGPWLEAARRRPGSSI
ncbi:MAG: hypothetical protein ABSG83_08020 [Roseiarcus sp.]